MRGKKSPMIMGLIGAMLLSTNAFAAVPSDFSDFPTDWSASAMTHAVQNGLLNGSDGKILPKGLLTRAQMATMVNRAFASSAKASLTSFTDMVPGAWHYNEMAKAVQMGVFQGADGKLSPNDPITREQAFAVLARAFGLADGRAAALNKFSDGAQISSWAKGAVAALVEQGYVSGADGALNPQSYITRAEFAQVMDALVAAYGDQDLKDQTVQGNLILRTNSTLENVTVKGDLILADGVSAATLKNVTVTGRLVVRGGTDGVSLTKSTPKKGIQLANPNGTPKVTVDGKAYNPNGTTNGGTNSGGSSSGGSSGGNSSTTQGAIVDAEKAKKTIATDAGTWLPLVFQDGYTSEGTTVTVDGQDVTQYVTNVTTEGTVARLPLVAQPGTVTVTSNGKTQTITIGTAPTSGSAVYTGADYLPDYYLGHTSLALWDYYLTNYDDEGNARVLPKQTTFSTTPAKNEHPSYSPVTKLNEDNTSGNVVIMFNYKNSAAKDGDEAWFDNIAEKGALELVQYDQYKTILNDHLTYTKDTTDHNGKVGTLTIPFNQDNFRNNGRYYVRVASTTTDGKKSYALVPIHVVNHDAPTFAIQETPESGRNLHFSVKNMVYGIVDPVEEVTLTKPDKTTVTLNKIDDYYLISQNLFVLYNDTTATNGKNHLDQKGAYVLTVKANGFQDAVCIFNVNDGKEVETPAAKAMRSYGIDVISGASTNIGGSDSSSSGGGYAISADLLFDSDLLANALVLEKVGAETSAASTVLNYWKSHVVSDAVFDKGDTHYYPIGAYISAVNTAQTKGTMMWIPFASYRTDAQATASQPRATKAVLEDGLLGDIQDSSTSGKLDAITPTVTGNTQGNPVVLTFTGDDATAYLSKINEDGLVYLNGNWRELGRNKYTVNLTDKSITFNANCFTIGKNTIRLKAAGYRVQDVEVNYTKVNETDLSLKATVDTETAGKVHIVVNNSNGDFLKNLKSITLTKGDEVDVVLAKGVEGSNAVYYVVAADNKSVDLYNVTEPGEYTVKIEANYYTAPLTATFTVEGEVTTLNVPNMIVKQSETNGVYRVEFHDNTNEGNPATVIDINNWKSAVTKVTVNNQEYTKDDGYSSIKAASTDYQWTYGAGSEQVLLLGGNAFVTGENKIVISAKGYNDFTYIITTKATEPEQGNVKVPETAPTYDYSTMNRRLTFASTDKVWLAKVNSVVVNEEVYTPTTDTYFYGQTYKIDTSAGTISFGQLKGFADNVIKLGTTDAGTLMLKVNTSSPGSVEIITGESGDQDSTKKTPPAANEVTKKSSLILGDSYLLSFDQSVDGNDRSAYVDAIKTVSVNNTPVQFTLDSSEGDGMYGETQVKFATSVFANDATYAIVIAADGYKDLTVSVTKSGDTFTINNAE